MKALEELLSTMLFEHGVKEGHASVRDHHVKRIEELFLIKRYVSNQMEFDKACAEALHDLRPKNLHVPVWVVLMEGHRPYVSTVEHTPGYYAALKAAGHVVVRAEIEIPGYVIDDGKVKATVKE